ncbi:MAG: hypothetical protein ABI200_06725 [Gaiellales bacterium]
MHDLLPTQDLDPRRHQRGIRRSDWSSFSHTVRIGGLHELLTRALVRIGIVR